jgi:hypothetical protein
MYTNWLNQSLFAIDALWAQVPITPTPTPAPANSVTVEMLREQIDFLKTANTQLADSFSRYVTTLNTTLTIVGFILSAITLIGAVLFGKSLVDFYSTLRNVNQEVDRRVRERVEREISVVVRSRVEQLEDILARETSLRRIPVDYIVPIAQLSQTPEGFHLLKGRGFQTTPKFIPVAQLQTTQFLASIIVLDLPAAGITRAQKVEGERIIQAVVDNLPYKKAVLVIYIPGFQSDVINQATEAGSYCIGAQSPLSLVGRVIEAAYVIDALRKM